MLSSVNYISYTNTIWRFWALPGARLHQSYCACAAYIEKTLRAYKDSKSWSISEITITSCPMESCTSLPVPPISTLEKVTVEKRFRNFELFSSFTQPSLLAKLDGGPFMSSAFGNTPSLLNKSYPSEAQDIHDQMMTSDQEALAIPAARSEVIGDSAASSPSSSTCNSPFAHQSDKTDSFLRQSTIDGSPGSSPNSFLEEGKIQDADSPNSKSFFSRRSSEDKSMSDQEVDSQASDGKVPKNIKLPQRKFVAI